MIEGRHRRRGAIAATIAATLLIPAVGSLAGPSKQLDRNQRQLEQIRRKIEAQSSKAHSLRRQVLQLNNLLTHLQLKVVKLDGEIKQVESQLRTAQMEVDETQAEIDRIEDIANEQAVELYMEGGTDTIDALLDSTSLGELDEKAELMGVAAQNNTSALIEYGRLRAEIVDQNRVLWQKRAELTQRFRDRSSLLSEITDKEALYRTRLGTLREQLGISKIREAHKEAENAEIRQAIIEHQAKAAVAALGTSNEGFIWPLNGEITSPYGERWGRMHTGIDINGVTGQPIVAAKEGKVIMASYYSGYGNAVIIDHGGGYSTLYGHMSSFATSNGAYVKQGELIGYVGCTGNCYGDHLHFEVRVNGEPVDPMPYLP